jgi:hypothetical protein
MVKQWWSLGNKQPFDEILIRTDPFSGEKEGCGWTNPHDYGKIPFMRVQEKRNE